MRDLIPRLARFSLFLALAKRRHGARRLILELVDRRVAQDTEHLRRMAFELGLEHQGVRAEGVHAA